MDVVRGQSSLTITITQSGMEVFGKHCGEAALQLDIKRFPLDFYLPLRFALETGGTTYPRVSLPFGQVQHFVLERQGGKKNDEVWFTFKTNLSKFFAIELRESEIKNLLREMKRLMTQ